MPEESAAGSAWSLERREDVYAVVDGLKVRYWDVGSGSPVILIHGLGASAEWWLPNVDALATRHRVLAVDLPGFGRSAKEGFAFTLRFATSFVAAFLDHVRADRASLIGNSMGGLITLLFALDYPERVDRLVLVGSGGLGREVALSLRLASAPLLGRLLLSRTTPKAMVLGTVGSILSNPETVPPEAVARWIELASLPGASTCSLQAARLGINVFGQRRSIVLRDRLSGIRAPTLIVWGDEDPVIPVEHAYAAHRLLPGCELRILKACRHCPQIERPAEFNELVLSFLAK